MERVVRGYMDPSNLISHCGKRLISRAVGWSEERKVKSTEDLETGFRMKWSLENGKRLITGD